MPGQERVSAASRDRQGAVIAAAPRRSASRPGPRGAATGRQHRPHPAGPYRPLYDSTPILIRRVRRRRQRLRSNDSIESDPARQRQPSREGSCAGSLSIESYRLSRPRLARLSQVFSIEQFGVQLGTPAHENQQHRQASVKGQRPTRGPRPPAVLSRLDQRLAVELTHRSATIGIGSPLRSRSIGAGPAGMHSREADLDALSADVSECIVPTAADVAGHALWIALYRKEISAIHPLQTRKSQNSSIVGAASFGLATQSCHNTTRMVIYG